VEKSQRATEYTSGKLKGDGHKTGIDIDKHVEFLTFKRLTKV
jgi:hypothetical protein